MTVLLKLLLDETEATVRQRRYPIDGEAESRSADSSFTLAPKRGQILFGVDALGRAVLAARLDGG